VEYLDTNVFIRYLTGDDPDQSAKASRLLNQVAQGGITATTSESVVVEIVQVLSSKVLYNAPRAEVRAQVRKLMTMRGLSIPNKRSYLRALDVFASTNLDFVDALSVAHVERAHAGRIVSFDRDFDRIGGVVRREP